MGVIRSRDWHTPLAETKEPSVARCPSICKAICCTARTPSICANVDEWVSLRVVMSPDPFAPLHEVLRTRRTAALIAEAEFIRGAPSGDERDDEARRAIREAMLLFSLRRITRAERDRLLDILSFVAVHEPQQRPDRPPYPFFDDPELHGPLV